MGFFPFTRGLTYLFPLLIIEFFPITGLSYAQTMLVISRILFMLDKLVNSRGLDIGIPDLASVYNLITDGSRCFVFQRLSSQTHLVLKVTQNDND
ncbi:hypothetical protein Hanom_Chr05g00438331 [Helianthus anomalus]